MWNLYTNHKSSGLSTKPSKLSICGCWILKSLGLDIFQFLKHGL